MIGQLNADEAKAARGESECRQGRDSRGRGMTPATTCPLRSQIVSRVESCCGGAEEHADIARSETLPFVHPQLLKTRRPAASTGSLMRRRNSTVESKQPGDHEKAGQSIANLPNFPSAPSRLYSDSAFDFWYSKYQASRLRTLGRWTPYLCTRGVGQHPSRGGKLRRQSCACNLPVSVAGCM